jgi:hypothetical protein
MLKLRFATWVRSTATFVGLEGSIDSRLMFFLVVPNPKTSGQGKKLKF